MVSRRDIGIAFTTMFATLAIVSVANSQGSILSSAIFDWNLMEAKPTEVGVSRRVFRSPTATLAELECHITTLNPGKAAHPPHKHPEEEVLIIKEGTVEALVNGQLKNVGPGSVIFQASNQLHTIRNVGTIPATYHVFSWQSPGMAKAKN